MTWFVTTLLVVAILVINDKFNRLMRLIEENDQRYGNRFTDAEVRVTKVEQKIEPKA